jgi:hypothetical protein
MGFAGVERQFHLTLPGTGGSRVQCTNGSGRLYSEVFQRESFNGTQLKRSFCTAKVPKVHRIKTADNGMEAAAP